MVHTAFAHRLHPCKPDSLLPQLEAYMNTVEAYRAQFAGKKWTDTPMGIEQKIELSGDGKVQVVVKSTLEKIRD